MDHSSTRRDFLKAAAALATPAVIASTTLGRDGAAPPSERVTMGFIGCGRQTYHKNIPLFVRTPGVQTLAVCDVDSWRLENAIEQVKSQYDSGKAKGTYVPVQPYLDYQDLLARDDIDAVCIGTPDHWHVPIARDAMRAGKDVALEKPITRTIREGQQLIQTASRFQRVFRVDSEFRSGRPAHRATSLVRNGYIGQVRKVLVCVPETDIPCPLQPEMPIPKELDYERWQGPAPRAPYTVRRVHPVKSYDRPGWMRHLYYCDGMITNWGTHLNNGAMWATDTERTGPVQVQGTGVYPASDSFWNVLLKFDIQYKFANGLQWTYRTDQPYFVIEGDEGWVRADFSKFDAQPKSLLTLELKPDDQTFRFKSEKQDFIDCVRSRAETLEPAEVGHRVTSMGHLGHIAIHTGRQLQWDPDKETFAGDEQANHYLEHPIQAPPDMEDPQSS
jgi:myo-inositol 2-dehydrogenase/D-chiro-inositol 1-dehydrogenase